MVQAYWPEGPYAHLNFGGEQGSGKTFTQVAMKRTVDPSTNDLRRPPKTEHDLMIAANNDRMLSFDNLSGMPLHLADAFCGMSTGVSLGARRLYTDADEVTFSARRPCVFNGIDTLTEKPDLEDRTITIDLSLIPKMDRASEKKMLERFDDIRASVLGLILDATVMDLRRIDTIAEKDLPRMADFACWVMACEPALPWKEGEFIVEYERQINDNRKSHADNDLVATAILSLIKVRDFVGTSTELLEILNERMGVKTAYPPQGWPRTPAKLGGRVRRAAPTLRANGLVVEWTKGGTRTITLKQIDPLGIPFRGTPCPYWGQDIVYDDLPEQPKCASIVVRQ
jgi:putative DNA primase/helicase